MTFGASNYTDDLRLAHFIADIVDSNTLSCFKGADFFVNYPDLSAAKVAVYKLAEEIIYKQLLQTRPRDSVYGSDLATSKEDRSRFWLVSPLVELENFVRKVPVWATLISLVVDSVPVVGVVSAPALNKRWWGAYGAGAYTGRSLAHAKKLQVSKVYSLSEASFSYTSLGAWWLDEGWFGWFKNFSSSVWRTSCYDSFWSYCMLAEGALDVVAVPSLGANNMAAFVPIITEASGRLSSFVGDNHPYGGSCLATNGVLHETVLDSLSRI